MSVEENRNVRNENALGLSSQRYECRRRRELEEESRAGDDTIGPPHDAGV